MPLSNEDFNLLKSHQYCDNPSCSHYQIVGSDNLKIYSRKQGQLYCKSCKSKPFTVTKGTIFFGLRTPLEKVVSTLRLLARGLGLNHVCAEKEVTSDTVSSWIIKAGNHVEELTLYMQQDLGLSQIQIDEFWSFIQKKKKI